MAYECTVLMPGNNLVKADRMGAAWSIEGRSPFLDHRVTEALVRLPTKSKFSDGVGKLFLKEFALGAFRRDLIFRKKTMPTTPVGDWIKGDLYDWAKDLLGSGDGYCINTGAAVRLLDQHKRGENNYTRELRTLLMTKLWLRTFFD